jgi:hypothetical protein
MLRRSTFTSPPSSGAATSKLTRIFSSSASPFLSIASRNVNFVNEPSKNNPNMKHLDIYARRDPQLAPYLLREVDIEYKRKCRKVNFVFWWSVLVALILLQSRESLECAFYLKHYTELLREELDAKDDDMDLRRAKMVQLLQLLRGVEKKAFDLAEKTNGKLSELQSKTSLFGADEMKEVEAILRSTEIPVGQRKIQEGTKEMKDMDLTGMGSKNELYSRKGASS